VNRPPQPFLYAFTPLGCTNKVVSFNVDAAATSSVNGTLAVNYGDGSSPITPPTLGVVAHTYTAPGIYTPTISFTDSAGCASIFSQQVSIQAAPSAADFIYVSNDIPPKYGPTFCAPVTISFSNTTVSSYSLNYIWDLGTGSPIVDEPVVANHYDNPGIQTVTLTASTHPNGCTATITHSFTILKPKAKAVIDKTNFCLGEPITLKIIDSSGVDGWAWFYGDGVTSGTIMANSSPATQTIYPYTFYPPPFGSTSVSLQYFAMASGIPCDDYSTIGIQVTKVDANFNRNDELALKDSVHCLNVPDLFTNKSKINNSTFINGLYFDWDFGNGVTSSSMSPGYTYPSPGVYTVTLKVTDPRANCVDRSVKNMTINALPTVDITLPDSVCRGSNFILVSNPSSDVSQFQWEPADGVASPNSFTTTATSTVSTTYSMFVTSIHGCTATSTGKYVYVQQPTTIINWDTTVVIGQNTPMNVNFGPSYTYTWSPTENLSCDHCPYAVSSSTANITYTVEVEDNMGCFRAAHTFSVNVDPVTSIDVPTAFTPNGDGVNDVIYVDGWGIKKLNYFKIFNRWGQLLFESYDIKVGWDGTYKGVPQNMETYIYQASAEGYIPGTLMEKTSSFRLIR
jgi:gliding motility-associated-like protein